MPSELDANQTQSRILIVDDHPIVRLGVEQMINLQPDLKLCCGASSAEDALAAMRRCHHDLAIVDISLAGVSGLNLIMSLAARYPGLPILAMSFHEETLFAERVLRLGAKGYIMKHQAVDHILTAIRLLLNGGIYLSEEMHGVILERLRKPSPSLEAADPVACLTDKEFEVLRLVGFGFGTRQIAEKLNRTIKTIETHRANIKDKLGLKTSAELARFAALWVEDKA